MLKVSLFVILAALLPLALAAPAQSEEMVLTPGGLRPKSSVIQIPEGGSINLTDTEVHLLDASKRVIHVSPRSDAKVRASPVTNATVPEQSGWISFAYWRRINFPIQNFFTTWVVPPTPATNHGQTIFLFNGLEPDTGDSILQPVLQWGPSVGGGGPFWQFATWYVAGATSFFTPLLDVSVGQSLQGIIQFTRKNADGTFNYVSEFAGSSGVALSNSPELTWAYETLEAYSVTTASDYPTGCTPFFGISISTVDGATAPVSWGITNDDFDGVHTYINVNGGSNGQVTTCYPL
ncbi:hypothetical protein E1B28_003731 [Marasmius oreades]|uniref:Uncharacterized protein n=1 Tax=Marasmius oreades TaxID=181124 RepID=A0A9P8ABA6_9AGAR|nr:uncharacterized protein E1B28_003731 [Marasmius oreades]KAG7096284.1 hypothetical protein E1B28_003731 [Marasmius oreades]